MNWRFLQANPTKAATLAQALGIDQTLAELLVLRGIDSFEKAKTFFRPSLEMLHDPFLMKDMQKGIDRLSTAIKNEEKIMIYGDYDVDGSTSVSLVYGFLSKYYKNLMYYIPDRYKEGYGLSFAGIEKAKEENCTLIITLDCGIKAVDKVDKANALGIDVIICDHHTPGKDLPKAQAIINPKQSDCPYPYKELPGCGIGFKLCLAYAKQQNIDEQEVFDFIDLVGIAICCDIVPITGENRVITYFALEKMNNAANLGVMGLLQTAKMNKEKPIEVEDIVFKIGPRINAAGRLKHAHEAVALLSHQDEQKAKVLSEQIHTYNEDRKALDRQTTAQALEMIKNDAFLKQAKSTVVYHENWHKGVIGIVASRLIETHYRPTIVFTKSGEKAAGSARSVKNYNVYKAIDACSDVLEQFGGHKYAAGLTIKPENIEAFRQKFEAYVSKTILEEQLKPKIEVDALIDFEQITPKFMRILKQMAPFGPYNLKPVFVTRGVVDAGGTRAVGADQTHVKFELCQAQHPDVIFNGIGFSLAKHLPRIKAEEPFSVLYTLEENYFRGQVSLQLMVKDLRFEDKS